MTTAHCACRKLSVQVSGNVRWSWDGSVWTLPPPAAALWAVRSVPRNWPGKDPTGRCWGDLYTSLVRPRPPASSAHPLRGRKEVEQQLAVRFYDCNTDSVKTNWLNYRFRLQAHYYYSRLYKMHYKDWRTKNFAISQLSFLSCLCHDAYQQLHLIVCPHLNMTFYFLACHNFISNFFSL